MNRAGSMRFGFGNDPTAFWRSVLQRVIPNMYVCCMCVCLCVCRPSDYSFEHAFVVQFATNWKASSENWKFPFKDICGE